MGNIVANALIVIDLDARIRYFMAASSDYEAYDEMGRKSQNIDQKEGPDGTIFHSSNRGTPSNTSGFLKFFTILGAIGLILWAGSKIVSYYALWMPVLEDYDDFFRYSQAMERYAEFLYAADAWGLFLVIVAIIAVLTFLVSELSKLRKD